MAVTTRYMDEHLASEEEWAGLAEALDRQADGSSELGNLYLGLAVDRVRLVADLLQIADSDDPASSLAMDMVHRLAVVDSRSREA